MKKLCMIVAGTAALLFSSTTASAAMSTKAYQPSTKYSQYVYKSYNEKGKLEYVSQLKFVKTSGLMKGSWRDISQDDYYYFYGYTKQGGLVLMSGDKSSFQYGSFKTVQQLPATVKKGQTGHLMGLDFSSSKYKVLSTSVKVKTPNGTYQKAIKIWAKEYGQNVLHYYVKNVGEVKRQTLYQGEYKTTYVLTKTKK